MTLTLVALAAGLGTRFGGPKQLAPLGPRGETILDYSLHDARSAGFDAVVLVVRDEHRAAFEDGLVARWRDRMPVTLVSQPVEPPRTKPWGTGHAVLAAAAVLGGPFAVVNADDFYGRDAFQALGDFLRGRRDDEPTYAVVGFPLGETLSDAGGVSRALLHATPDGWLVDAEEIRGIRADATMGERVIPRDALVSMGMWGFTRALLPRLAEEFATFRAAYGADPGAEFFLPSLVDALVSRGQARVRVLAGMGPWLGVTYADERARVAAALASFAARGDYPSPAWA